MQIYISDVICYCDRILSYYIYIGESVITYGTSFTFRHCSTVNVCGFKYKLVNDDDRDNLHFELELSHSAAGPWQSLQSSEMGTEVCEGETGTFYGAAQFWRWKIFPKRACILAFSQVSFKIQGGEVSLDIFAPRRLELCFSNRTLNRLIKLSRSLLTSHDKNIPSTAHTLAKEEKQNRSTVMLGADVSTPKNLGLSPVARKRGLTSRLLPLASTAPGSAVSDVDTFFSPPPPSIISASEGESKASAKAAGKSALPAPIDTPHKNSNSPLDACRKALTNIMHANKIVNFTDRRVAVCLKPEFVAAESLVLNPTEVHRFSADDLVTYPTTRATVQPTQPITGLVIICHTLGQAPPPGYIVIPKDLHAGCENKIFYLCYSQEPGDPITDVAILYGTQESKSYFRDPCPAGWERAGQMNRLSKKGRETTIVFRKGSGAPIDSLAVAFLDGEFNERSPSDHCIVAKNLNEGNSIRVQLSFRRSACLPRIPRQRREGISEIAVANTPIGQQLEVSDDWEVVVCNSRKPEDFPLRVNKENVYIIFRRNVEFAPITALQLTTSKDCGQGWQVIDEPVDRTKTGHVYLAFRRDVGAAPLVQMMFMSSSEPAPTEFFSCEPLLVKGRGGHNVRLCYAVAPSASDYELITETAKETVDSVRFDSSSSSLRKASHHATRDQLGAVNVLLAQVDKRQLISVEVEGYYPLQFINIQHVTEETYVLEPVVGHEGARLTICVMQSHCGKEIDLRAPLSIINQLPFPLELCCPKNPDDDSCILVVPSQERASLPLGILDVSLTQEKWLPLYRFWSVKEKIHYYTTNPLDVGALSAGFVQETILGYIFAHQQSGTIPLRGTKPASGLARNLYTLTTNRALCNYDRILTPEQLHAQGYVILGYVHGSLSGDEVPLYRYSSIRYNDCLFTVDRDEVGVTEKKTSGRCGYTFDCIECFLVRHPGLIRVRPYGQTFQWSFESRNLLCSREPALRWLSCFPITGLRSHQMLAMVTTPQSPTEWVLQPALSLHNTLPIPIKIVCLPDVQAAVTAPIDLHSGERYAVCISDFGKDVYLRMAMEQPLADTEGAQIIVPNGTWSSAVMVFSSYSFYSSPSLMTDKEDKLGTISNGTSGSGSGGAGAGAFSSVGGGIGLTASTSHSSSTVPWLSGSRTLSLLSWTDNSRGQCHIRLAVNVARKYGLVHGPLEATISVPCLMVNETGLMSGLSSVKENNVMSTFRLPGTTFALYSGLLEDDCILSVGSHVSDSFSLMAASGFKLVQTKARRISSKEDLYELTAVFGWNSNGLTRTVTIFPTVVISNETPWYIGVCSVTSCDPLAPLRDLCIISPFSSYPLNSHRSNSMWRMRAQGETLWSTPFSPYKEQGLFYLKMESISDGQLVLMQASVSLLQHHVVVELSPVRESAPFRLENHSHRDIVFWQQGAIQKYLLKAGQRMDYALDDPVPRGSPPSLCVLESGSRSAEPSVVLLYSESPQSILHREKPIYACGMSDEDCHVLLLVDAYGDAANVVGLLPSVRTFSMPQYNFVDYSLGGVFLSGIGLSLLMDRSLDQAQPKELVYAAVQGIQISSSQSISYNRIFAVVKSVQVDHQAYKAHFPCVLSTTAVDEPVMSCQAIVARCEPGLRGFESTSLVVRLQPLRLRVDGFFANEVRAFLTSLDISFEEADATAKTTRFIKQNHFDTRTTACARLCNFRLCTRLTFW